MSRKTIVDQLWLVSADITVTRYMQDEVEVERVHRIVKADTPREAEDKVRVAYGSNDPYGSSYSVEILSTTGVLA